jgi:2-C-methyl-D-erythritol 2,4-cyclodiphosphate synthase
MRFFGRGRVQGNPIPLQVPQTLLFRGSGDLRGFLQRKAKQRFWIKSADKLLGCSEYRLCDMNELMVYVGIGYDVHQLVAGRKLVLGGVEIPHTKGLDGHSDADVLMHAICDAILGALGEGDIGQFFPNTDPRWRGAASKIFLQEAARQVNFRKGRIVNIDATIVAQQPKVMPHTAQMKINIAEALGIAARRVGIKATTNEHLGFIGREEGIAAMAVAGVDLAEAD